MNKITVIGSCNTDLVVRCDHIPRPGETILGTDFITNQGGKGANQAVAVARLGGDASFIARVGDDNFGHESLQLLRQEGINTDHVSLTAGAPTGIAMISVDDNGENSIIVAGGANAMLNEADVDAAAEVIRTASILLMQLETPIPTLTRAAQIAHDSGVKVVLNPAPFPKEHLPEQLLKNVDIITPNETESSMMANIAVTDEASVLKAIERIRLMGVSNVIITAGGAGAYTVVNDKLLNVPAFKTDVIDTTAAGDTFCGALCVALSEGKPIADAIRFANKAASISVTRMGAWRSIPRREEINM